jgi:hypothetical protein
MADALVISFHESKGFLLGYSFGDYSKVALNGALQSCKMRADLKSTKKDELH